MLICTCHACSVCCIGAPSAPYVLLCAASLCVLVGRGLLLSLLLLSSIACVENESAHTKMSQDCIVNVGGNQSAQRAHLGARS